MLLLTISVIVFIIVIALIVYANMPRSKGCPSDSCNQCGMPRRRCGCGKPPGCPFC